MTLWPTNPAMADGVLDSLIEMTDNAATANRIARIERGRRTERHLGGRGQSLTPGISLSAYAIPQKAIDAYKAQAEAARHGNQAATRKSLQKPHRGVNQTYENEPVTESNPMDTLYPMDTLSESLTAGPSFPRKIWHATFSAGC